MLFFTPRSVLPNALPHWIRIIHVGHTPGVGAYAVYVDTDMGADEAFRGTLGECHREAERLANYEPSN